jgi:hypothetical protein
MRAIATALASVACFAGLLVPSQAATLGGYDYAVQYDFRDFFAATDNKPFQVVIVGNPFPNLPPEEVARRMLPLMQAAKPPPNLTFTYDTPKEEPRPYYRLVLVFNAVNDVGADSVCRGNAKTTEGTPGKVRLFSVYCRNDMSMSQVISWTSAQQPDEPEMLNLYKQLFMQQFPRGAGQNPQNGYIIFR